MEPITTVRYANAGKQGPQFAVRTVNTGPICVVTEQGKLFFNSAQCAEHVLTALFLARSQANH